MATRLLLDYNSQRNCLWYHKKLPQKQRHLNTAFSVSLKISLYLLSISPPFSLSDLLLTSTVPQPGPPPQLVLSLLNGTLLHQMQHSLPSEFPPPCFLGLSSVFFILIPLTLWCVCCATIPQPNPPHPTRKARPHPEQNKDQDVSIHTDEG